MNTAQIVGSLMLLGALAAAWSRYSIAPAGVARLEELYLWLVPASVGLLAMLHDFAGIRVLLAVAGVHVALIVFALAMVTRRAAPGTAPQALAAAGLITGSAVVWIAATTFPGMSLQAIAAERTGHLVTTGGFVLGTLLTLAAFVFIDVGEQDQVLVWLEKAYEERSGWMSWLKVEPMFDRLRRDPRFADLLRRVGLPQ